MINQKTADDTEGLTAYLVPRLGHTLPKQTLQDFSQKALPPYMIPQTFVLLEAMPLTDTGQINRSALVDLTTNLSQPDKTSGVRPHHHLEQQLIPIWEAVLGVQSVGVDDNFFDLGGTSFLAVCLMNQIQQELGIEQPPYTFLYQPTIAQLAQQIAVNQGTFSGQQT